MLSPSPTIKHLRFCDDNAPLVKEGCLASILKYIGLMEEEDLEVFVDDVDDKFAPTSPTLPGAKDDRALMLIPPNIVPTPTWSSGNAEALILERGACRNLSKVASVRGVKSSG